MGFKFAEQKKWIRKGIGGFSTAIVGFILIVVQVYLVESINHIVFLCSFIPLLVGLFKGIHYVNLSEHDYIFLEENCLSIYKGPLFPKKQIAYTHINYCVEMSGLIIFYLKDNKEAQFNADWLLYGDIVEIKKQLRQRVRVDNLFRNEAESYTLYSQL